MDVVEQLPEPFAQLPDDQKRLREQFVKQYVIEYDAVKACMEMGYTREWAAMVADKMLACPYVAKLVRQFEDDTDGDVDIESRRLFAGLRREASYHGPGSSHGARVAALTKLASLRGMDKPVKHELDVTNRGGVMVVPGIVSLEDWENAATKSQEDLTSGA